MKYKLKIKINDQQLIVNFLNKIYILVITYNLSINIFIIYDRL
jgi:hypothetical protein